MNRLMSAYAARGDSDIDHATADSERATPLLGATRCDKCLHTYRRIGVEYPCECTCHAFYHGWLSRGCWQSPSTVRRNRAGYVLAMAILQSPLYGRADAETRAAIQVFLPPRAALAQATP